MPERILQILLPAGFVLLCLYALYNSVARPGTLVGSGSLVAAIFLEILAVALWNYRGAFFALLMASFFWAGMALPLSGVATGGRWVVLALGAIVGLVLYLRERAHFFGNLHLVALSCVLSGLASAMVSLLPRIALLKAASLLLLFVYGATGGRLAVIGREARFFVRLLLACEFLVYLSAVCYFVLHQHIFGNPNSMGAVMGIAAMPLLLWGVLVSEETWVRRRRTAAAILCLCLLLSSYARAGIVAAAASSLLLCLGLRRYRLLLNGFGVALAAAVLTTAVAPLSGTSGSLAEAFLYKGHANMGFLGSRASPWQKTSAVIQAHPWFGKGFGTSASSSEVQTGTFSSTIAESREHGNSYLAILEWVGLLGVIPFAALIFMVVLNIGRVWIWMRRTGSPYSPAIPIAAVLAGGLVHAAFEDWLFAVGYYMCVLFWTLAFVLSDVLRPPAAQPVEPMPPYASHPWVRNYGVATPGQ